MNGVAEEMDIALNQNGIRAYHPVGISIDTEVFTLVDEGASLEFWFDGGAIQRIPFVL